MRTCAERRSSLTSRHIAAELACRLVPDVMVMDISMPRLNGLEATEMLKTCCPGVKVLMLTRHPDLGYVQQLMRAGARGYVLKQSRITQVLHAIRAIAEGGLYLDPAVAETVVGPTVGRGSGTSVPRLTIKLSAREEEVLRLMAWGFTNKEIAARLNLSVKTIETHRTNAMQKMGMHNRSEIVRFALLQGWLNEL